MKFSVAAVLGAAAAVQAGYSNVSYTTEVVTAYTTYCPYATTLTNNGQTITVTEATTVTFTNCPCTITKPVSTYSSVVCNSCPPSNTSVPAAPAPPPAAGTTTMGSSPAGTTSVATLPTAGAGKAAALSGAGLAGVLGLAAFAL